MLSPFPVSISIVQESDTMPLESSKTIRSAPSPLVTRMVSNGVTLESKLQLAVVEEAGVKTSTTSESLALMATRTLSGPDVPVISSAFATTSASSDPQGVPAWAMSATSPQSTAETKPRTINREPWALRFKSRSMRHVFRCRRERAPNAIPTSSNNPVAGSGTRRNATVPSLKGTFSSSNGIWMLRNVRICVPDGRTYVSLLNSGSVQARSGSDV